MKHDEALDPADVRPLGARTVMTRANARAHPIEQLRAACVDHDDDGHAATALPRDKRVVLPKIALPATDRQKQLTVVFA